jgi:AraC-like DNA-binding protein
MDYQIRQEFFHLPQKNCPLSYSNRKYPLHAITNLTGHSIETSPDYRHNNTAAGNSSSYVAWQYTLKGKGRIDLADGSRDLLPGSLMVITIPGPHTYYLPDGSDSWEFVFLTMTGREAIRLNSMVEYHFGNVLNTANLGDTISLLYEILEKSFSGGISDPLTNSSYTYRICISLLKEIGYPSQEPQKRIFDSLIKYLKDNIQSDISVKEMAEFMHLSYGHFFNRFREEMGINPSEYFEDIKLRAAIDYLLRDRISVKETAYLCGFRDVNYFCRLFRKRFGISPGKYKNKEIMPRG